MEEKEVWMWNKTDILQAILQQPILSLGFDRSTVCGNALMIKGNPDDQRLIENHSSFPAIAASHSIVFSIRIPHFTKTCNTASHSF